MACFRVLVIALAIVACAASSADPVAAKKTMADYKAEKAAEAAKGQASAATEAKMAAVNKVVTMLEDLQKQVLEEGESEAKTYNEFACWCKTTMKDKEESIKKGKDDKASLSAAITKTSATRKDLDTKVGVLETDIAEAQTAMKEATTTSNAALAEYETNEADLSAAVAAIKGAIKMLSGSKNPSLMQLQGVSKTVRQAVIMADALGLDVPGMAMLQQQGDAPDVAMEDYKFHSDSIIGTLEKLKAEFTSEKNKVDAEEVKRAQAFHMLMQEKTDLVKAKTNELEDRQKSKSKAQEDIAENQQELTTVSATLLDDMDYLKEVYEISSAKAKTWDQRSKVRADELSALTAATGIVKEQVTSKTRSATVRFAQQSITVRLADAVAGSDDAMEAIEESAEDVDNGAVGFLQRVQIKKHASAPVNKATAGRQAIVDLLRSKGQKLNSKFLSALASEVASQNGADVFAKIKVLIQELIERLLTEAANESSHKGWCSKAIADAEQKRTYSAEEVATLNADLADDEAKLDKLNENIGTLDADITEVKAAIKEAESMRAAEKSENNVTVIEAEAGLDATKMAIQILSRFYATAAKAKVDLSLAQGPRDDMPDAGFEEGEAYQGAGGAEGGIVGMLEVISSDFVRTIKETEKAEAQAQADHLAFMTESGKSLAEKTMARGQTGKSKDATELKLEKDGESLKAQVTILKTSIEELMELQPACVDTGMSYGDRVARREEEVQALKKALCILNAYASFGPDGLADAC